MKTDENVDKARPLIQNNHCLSIRMAAEELNMDKKTVTQITTRNFNIRKVWAMIMSKKLNEGQKLKINLC
jgi:PP-loop superfamily ATP-utilizing enzyme